MRAGPLTTRGHWARLLGYALSIIVVGVLVAWFLGRISDLSDEAEQLAFENNLTALRHAVHIESVRVLATEGTAGLAKRVGTNPLAWLEWNPDSPADSSPRSHWSFDPERAAACYRWTRSDRPRRCWRVEVDSVPDAAAASGETPIRLRLQEQM